MSLIKNERTGYYEADIRHRMAGRMHLQLAKKRAEAANYYSALVQLMDEGHPDLVEALRKRRLTIAAVYACVRDKKPFDTLRRRNPWPMVTEAIDGYVAWLEAHPEKAGSTATTAASQLEQFRAFVEQHPELGAEARLDQVTSAQFATFQGDMASRFAKNSLANYLARVGAVYRWAQKREDREAREQRRGARILHSPIDDEALPKGRTRRERYLTEAEAERLIAATPDPLRFPVACGLLAGLRIDETLHLRPVFDVDLSLGLLIVQERGTRGTPGYWRPKGKKRREVPIADDLRPILERHLERYASESYACPSLVDPDAPGVAHTLRQHFERIVVNAGLTYGRGEAVGVVYHTLRHTFASWLVMRGVDLYSVAQLLGNSLKMVEQTYAHLAPDFKRAAVGKLAGAVTIALPKETDA